MNVETINVWGQLIASIGVIVSLFYVAAQVRQNTRSSRAIVVDSLARSMHDLAIEMAQNDQLLTTATMLKDWNSASELERARYASFMLGYFKLFENGWFQMRQGTLERDSGTDTTLFCARSGWCQPSRHGGPCGGRSSRPDFGTTSRTLKRRANPFTRSAYAD